MKDIGFCIENNGMAQQFSTAEREQLSIQSLRSSENIKKKIFH